MMAITARGLGRLKAAEAIRLCAPPWKGENSRLAPPHQEPPPTCDEPGTEEEEACSLQTVE